MAVNWENVKIIKEYFGSKIVKRYVYRDEKKNCLKCSYYLKKKHFCNKLNCRINSYKKACVIFKIS